MASTRFVLGYKCSLCGKFFQPNEASLTCPDCGEKGILDVVFGFVAANDENEFIA